MTPLFSFPIFGMMRCSGRVSVVGWGGIQTPSGRGRVIGWGGIQTPSRVEGGAAIRPTKNARSKRGRVSVVDARRSER